MVFLFFFFFKGKISQFRTQCFKFFPNSRLSRHVKSSQVCRTLHFRHRSTGKQSSLPSSRFSRIPWNSRPTNDHRYFSSSQKSSINNTNLPYQCVHRSPNLFPLSQFSLMKISFDKWISRLLIFRTICDSSPFLFDRLGNSRNNSRLARHLYSFDVQFISKYSVWNNRRFLCKKKLQNKMSRNEIKIFLFKSDCLLMVSWLFLDL